jgi:hypothetical protein
MKPISPHDPRNDPFDDLIAAALHGELTPEERTQFDARLQTDPAAQAAYQEAQAMHDLLDKNYKAAQPDPAFEQRMVSGVRRKIQHEQHRETAWESLLALWTGVKSFVARKRKPIPYLGSAFTLMVILTLLAGVALGPITNGIKSGNQVKSVFSTINGQLANGQLDVAGQASPSPSIVPPVSSTYRPSAARLAQLDKSEARLQAQLRTNPSNQNAARLLANIESQKQRYVDGTTINGGSLTLGATTTTPQGGAVRGSGTFVSVLPGAAASPRALPVDANGSSIAMNNPPSDAPAAGAPAMGTAWNRTEDSKAKAGEKKELDQDLAANQKQIDALKAPTVITQNGQQSSVDKVTVFPYPAATDTTTPATDTRKLIRNAELELEVKSFQAAMDQITALTKSAGGYVDTSNSQKGGNGKLQGTVVVKVLPQNLDGFLLKLRDLGEVKNQSVSTDDVTKAYFDTQARLDNSRRMETQLQDLLKHENSKVSDLLQVERELGRVRGEIEQMQGQLKLYDFQVQYATVTMQMREKDLNQAAAYLLKEQDQFSLFATDVEGTFQKARQTADDFKAQILAANLNHNSGSDVSAELVVMVAPDQIEPFLAQVRSLGRVANFTRQTQRVAKDGGDSDQPADQALTEKDKVQVHLAIRSDDETRKQVALTVVAKAVDDALEQAKTAALANAGVEILNSSLNKTPQGQSTAQLTVRVPGKDYSALIGGFQALGRTASLSIQRNDNSGPGANGDDAPVIVSLALTDDDTPLQETEMSVLASDVDNLAQQIKKDAAAAGVEVKASSFERQPDGTELARMTFRLPMSKYPAFVESVKKLGKVESLTVRRDDRPDQTRTDDTAPAEITLQLHNQRDIVADNSGLWATLRQTFGEGAAALFGSVRVIGVVIAFLAPWVFTLVLLAWVGRRIYIWRKK